MSASNKLTPYLMVNTSCYILSHFARCHLHMLKQEGDNKQGPLP